MKKAIIITAIIGMFVWAVYEYIIPSDAPEISEGSNDVNDKEGVDADSAIGIDKGDLAPDFELSTLDGDVVKLSDYKGKRVMLNFWATWCPPCRAEMPDMQKFHENKDVVILAVNLTGTPNENEEKVLNFAKDFGITFPILLDETTKVADLYQIQPIPTSFLIDSSGQIQNKAFGALNYELMVQEFEKMN